jgi:hypothetical protein
MKTLFFTKGTEIPDVWTAYIENEASAISRLDDFEIDNYADRQIYNPDMQAFLAELPDTQGMLSVADDYALTLSFSESRSQAVALFGLKFSRLKRKIREILCKIIADLAGDGDLNWKDIIKAVLVALIPVLGGGPLSLIVLPILISLVAKLIKRGMDAVCPVAA